MKLSFDYNTPIYLQLVEKIRFQIISGDLQPGDRVLSVREWALQEKVNPNTMQKALVELESAGLILTERTNGKFVTTDHALILRCRQEEAERIASEFYGKMSKIGMDRYNALEYLENMKGEKD